MSRRNNTEPMKVVFISTEYVETDATSFKSVVQRLTGKDSVVGSTEPKAADSGRAQPARVEKCGGGVGGGLGLSRGVSFKDFDGLLLKELPPLDELYWLAAD